MRRNPEVYYRDCNHCLEFLYDEETGKPAEYHGELIKRPVGRPAECRRGCGGCPKGTPEKQNVLSWRNQRALKLHRMCKLTGRWPSDRLVIERGILIEELEEIFKAEDELARLAAVTGARMTRGVR